MKATTIRMDDETINRVDSLAKSVNRSRTWVINQAVERFLSYEEWFIQEVQEGMKEVADGKTASPQTVEKRMARWGINED